MRDRPPAAQHRRSPEPRLPARRRLIGSVVGTLIGAHVAAGVTWLAVSIAVSLRRRVGRVLLFVQVGASLLNLVAGTLLWHALHSSGMGPVEHRLVVGTVCAFVALGLQSGVIGVLWNGPLASGALWLYRISTVVLTFAAAAMVASRLT